MQTNFQNLLKSVSGLLILILFLTGSLQPVVAQQTKNSYKTATSSSTEEGKALSSAIASNPELKDVWKVLNKAKTPAELNNSVEELRFVQQIHKSSGLSYKELRKSIVADGGYTKWKENNTYTATAPEPAPKESTQPQAAKDNDAGSFFKSLKQFTATMGGADTIPDSVAQRVFNLYNQEKWLVLFDYIKMKNLNGGWPPANGGYDLTDSIPLLPGQRFDRYSTNYGFDKNGNPILPGEFTSPIINNKPFSFNQRALPKPENEYDFYYVIEVLKELPFKGQTGWVIPWYGEPGNGKQTQWFKPNAPGTTYTVSWNDLAANGYIRITIISSPSGKYPDLAGRIIEASNK